MGKATIRGYRFPRHKAFPAWGRWRAKRAGWGSSGVKKSGKDRLKYAVCESTLSTAARSPCPNGEGFDTGIPLFSTQRLSPMGKAKRKRLRRKKRTPTPPRCARQPLPREGARVDTPSFLWKEVPRRGGGWMGEALSPKHSLPRVGKVASGASRIGF